MKRMIMIVLMVIMTIGISTIAMGFNIKDKTAIAYSPAGYNTILNMYGNTLQHDKMGVLPSSYMKVKRGIVVYNKTAIAYSPRGYHDIFTAYGLTLSPEDAKTMKGAIDYSKVVNGKIIFNESSIAYSNWALHLILKSYKKPVVLAAACVDTDRDGVCDDIDDCLGTPKGAKVDDRGCWVVDKTLLFDFDKAVIKEKYIPIVGSIADVMKQNPKMSIIIEGHTDSVGSVKYNQGLSERRANAIKTCLTNRFDIDPSRTKVYGYGESKPIASNKTKAGRAKNRRTELSPLW